MWYKYVFEWKIYIFGEVICYKNKYKLVFIGYVVRIDEVFLKISYNIIGLWFYIIIGVKFNVKFFIYYVLYMLLIFKLKKIIIKK